MTSSDRAVMQVVLDLLMNPLEKSFLEILKREPEDEVTRNAYIDYLKEKGRDSTAELVKSHEFPENEARKYKKVVSGVIQSGNLGLSPLISGAITVFKG